VFKPQKLLKRLLAQAATLALSAPPREESGPSIEPAGVGYTAAISPDGQIVLPVEGLQGSVEKQSTSRLIAVFEVQHPLDTVLKFPLELNGLGKHWHRDFIFRSEENDNGRPVLKIFYAGSSAVPTGHYSVFYEAPSKRLLPLLRDAQDFGASTERFIAPPRFVLQAA